jgi:hypothetical protein
MRTRLHAAIEAVEAVRQTEVSGNTGAMPHLASLDDGGIRQGVKKTD